MARKLLFFLLWQVGFSLSIANPADPALYSNGLCCGDPCSLFSWKDAFTLRLGFYGDYTYNRNLWVKHGEGVSANEIKRYSYACNEAAIILDVCRNVQIAGLIGTNSAHMVFTSGVFSTSSTLATIEFSTNYAWGVIAQGILWNPGNFYVGASLQYQRHRPRVKRILRHDSASIVAFSGNSPAVYEDWQVALAMAYAYHACNFVLTPFVGIKAAGGELDFGYYTFTYTGTGIVYTLNTLQPKKLWGYAIGLGAVLGERIGVTAEVRLADEKALGVNGQFRF